MSDSMQAAPEEAPPRDPREEATATASAPEAAGPDPAGPAPAPAGLARKLLGVGLMLGALLVPHWAIQDLIAEREGRRDEVRAEIARAWAEPQALVAPMLQVPYRVPAGRDAGAGTPHWRRGSLTLLPAALTAEVALQPETRRRGLFEAVVYGARVALSGSFALPEAGLPDMPDAEILWREAVLLAGSNDLRLAGPAGQSPVLSWAGQPRRPAESQPDLPGALPCALPPAQAIAWPLGLEERPRPGQAFPFAVTLELRGSGAFHLVPLARQAELAASAPWPSPSFTGAGLPAETALGETGFRARWTAGTRQALLRRGAPAEAECAAAAIGVALLEAVPTYRMVSRAAKYGLFFLALSTVTYALFELTAGVRLHAVQYGLLGASLVLFPLLLLAIGEPLGFAAAYALSAAAVAAQATAYTGAATGRAGLAALLALVLGALFGFLYVVLSLEAYALLVGTLAVFVALSVVMAATRRVRWGR